MSPVGASVPGPAWARAQASDAAAAFTAVEAIEEGRWDHFLLRVRAAVAQRMATDEYKRHLVAGAATREHMARWQAAEEDHGGEGGPRCANGCGYPVARAGQVCGECAEPEDCAP